MIYKVNNDYNTIHARMLCDVRARLFYISAQLLLAYTSTSWTVMQACVPNACIVLHLKQHAMLNLWVPYRWGGGVHQTGGPSDPWVAAAAAGTWGCAVWVWWGRTPALTSAAAWGSALVGSLGAAGYCLWMGGSQQFRRSCKKFIFYSCMTNPFCTQNFKT